MTEIVSIKFNERGKAYYFDPAGHTVEKGEYVVVETSKGLEYGLCVRGNHEVEDDVVILPLRPVVRIATETDNRSAMAGKEKEKEAFDYCKEKITEFDLEMKLVSVEYGFEGNKVLFFFTSDGRVDFRELVKDLASKFRARIELRQIGVRDEAKMLGGLGVCGKQFCCSQFLHEFHPVSIKMAKTQGLSLNPTKISGTCGRLMCCLKYEEAAYEDLVKKAPKIGAFVETPHGKGSVININLLRGLAKVRLEDGNDTTLKAFTFDELDILGGKGRRAEYITARDEGRLEEAGFMASPPPVPVRSLENTQAANDYGNYPSPGILSDETPDELSYETQAAETPPGTAEHNKAPKKQSWRKNKQGQKDKNTKDKPHIIKADQNLGEGTPSHPAPLEGAKKKKPHYKRRKNRNKKNNG